MKKIISSLIILTMLIGFSACGTKSQNEPSATSSTEKLIKTSVEESTEFVTSGENQGEETAKSVNEPSQSETKIQTAKPVHTEAMSTAKYIPSNEDSDNIPFRRSGDMYYIYDQKYSEKQNNIQGIALENYFPSGKKDIKKLEVSFSYDGKDWKIVLSKGTYSYHLVGSEIAVLTADEGEYCVPAIADRPKIQIEVTDKSENSILKTDYATHWWANGFYEGEIKSPNDITAKSRITFYNEELTKQFASKLDEQGLKAVNDEQSLTDNTYCIKGSSLWLMF